MSALPLPSGQGVLNTDVNPMLLGWIDFSWFGSTLAYVSADAPTFVFSVNADVTAVLEPGMRVKLAQTTDKFFIVTAVGAYAAGVTPITVYGGTDYTLANASISAGSFSTHKKPYGFNVSPAKWTETFSDTSDRSTATPTGGTWYNPGALSLSFPIGLWRAVYEATIYAAVSSGNQLTVTSALSTANNSASDADMTAAVSADMPTGSLFISATVSREKILLLAAKTTYYLNISGGSGMTSIAVQGSSGAKTFIRAVCAYL